MPIYPIVAFVLQCDICHRLLKVAARVDHLFNIEPHIFWTPATVRISSIASDWTITKDLVACPKCSPITGPPPTLTPTSADRGAGSPPGPAAES